MTTPIKINQALGVADLLEKHLKAETSGYPPERDLEQSVLTLATEVRRLSVLSPVEEAPTSGEKFLAVRHSGDMESASANEYWIFTRNAHCPKHRFKGFLPLPTPISAETSK